MNLVNSRKIIHLNCKPTHLNLGSLLARIIFAVGVLGSPLCTHAQTGTIQDVQHVVILMQENRSFDHYLGSLRGVSGFNDRNVLLFPNGNSVFYQPTTGTNYLLPFHTTNACLNDVGHDEDSGLEAWDGGWWNDWLQSKGPTALCYYTRNELPFYYALADNYTICDQNFCSFIGPTFPNRLYLFTGMIDPTSTGGGPVIDNSFPPQGFKWTTYPERLQAAGVSWKVYRPNGDWFGDALQWFSNYINARPGNPLYDCGMVTVNDTVKALAADVTNGTLPSVSWIIPTWDQSEHPSVAPDNGESFVNQIINTLELNTNVFNSTVFIITYDENGGFYDHVPAPIPPLGTKNEYVKGQPTGLGIRVPMFIISPWSRGGKVCSQIFDHTSIIRFLETWTGVQEPNISDWRRQVCGDLTSAFDFAHPDTSFPILPKVNPVYANAVTPNPPSPQIPPAQESGSRTSNPLPYQPNANSYTDCNNNQLCISMTNSGTASVHYWIYSGLNLNDQPDQFDVAPGNTATDNLNLFLQSRYDFTCYGPDGFQRRFAGKINRDCGQLEVSSTISPSAGGIILTMQNASASRVIYTVTDGYGLGGPWTYVVPANSSATDVFGVLANNNGWYDLLVTCSGDARFLRRLMGHVESGIPDANDSTTLVSTDFTSSLDTALTSSPLDAINELVANTTSTSAPPPVGTSPLTLSAGSAGGYVALFYPSWASNSVIQTSADLSQWLPVNVNPINEGGWRVVILPMTTPNAFFRLLQP